MKCCCAASGAAEGGLCSLFLGPVSSLASPWPTQPPDPWGGRSVSCSRAGASSRHQKDILVSLSLRKQGAGLHAVRLRVQHVVWGEGDDFRPFTEEPREGGLDLRGLWCVAVLSFPPAGGTVASVVPASGHSPAAVGRRVGTCRFKDQSCQRVSPCRC